MRIEDGFVMKSLCGWTEEGDADANGRSRTRSDGWRTKLE